MNFLFNLLKILVKKNFKCDYLNFKNIKNKMSNSENKYQNTRIPGKFQDGNFPGILQIKS